MIHQFILGRCVQCNLPLEELESVGWECRGHANSTPKPVCSLPPPENSHSFIGKEDSSLGVTDTEAVSQDSVTQVQQFNCRQCGIAILPATAISNRGFCCICRRPAQANSKTSPLVTVLLMVILAIIVYGVLSLTPPDEPSKEPPPTKRQREAIKAIEKHIEGLINTQYY